MSNVQQSFALVPLRVLKSEIGRSREFVGKLRKSGEWVDGIHYVKMSPKSILYNLELCRDYLVNFNSPSAHQRAIEVFLESLPSSAPRRKRK